MEKLDGVLGRGRSLELNLGEGDLEESSLGVGCEFSDGRR